MINLLIEELKEIQMDYTDLLKQIVSSPENKLSKESIDQVNLFWFKNRNVVSLAGKYLFKDKNTYCFTAATTYNVDDREQDSFFFLGDYHIFDDPVPNYINDMNQVKETSDNLYFNFLRSKVFETMKDNLRLIEEFDNMLWVIPLRFVSELLYQHDEELHTITENLFCQLFTNINNINAYQETVKTVSDIENCIDNNKTSYIILYDGDLSSNTWKERIDGFRRENKKFISPEYSDGMIFQIAVYGYFRQALSIIDISNNFNVIPFIRSKTPFNYFLFLIQMIEFNLGKEHRNPRSNEIEIKSFLAHILYREYEKYSPIANLKAVYQKSFDTDFQDKLYTEVQTYYENKNFPMILEVINIHLKSLLY
ncbi:hypothetical protein IA940_03955 [Listeria marthii]|uniref:hypothetical protein n=1 Tax=Listeria marthii TaxID=529731 RepID=UPI00188858C0|nr:hypothetical protein [Listeria marthii]MBF2515710.1 hypothetical protein [Listeria marthii]MBF2519074.1 hypothetical protein [Listeria marthii]